LRSFIKWIVFNNTIRNSTIHLMCLLHMCWGALSNGLYAMAQFATVSSLPNVTYTKSIHLTFGKFSRWSRRRRLRQVCIYIYVIYIYTYIYVHIHIQNMFIYTYKCTYIIFIVSLLLNEVCPRPKFSKVSLMLMFPRKLVRFLESWVYSYCV